MYKDELKKTLNEVNPEIALRNFALKLYAKKIAKDEIYHIFYEYYVSILNGSDQSKVDTLGDVMDMIVGTYSGKNIDFENETHNDN